MPGPTELAQQIYQINRMHDEGQSWASIAKQLGLARSTVWDTAHMLRKEPSTATQGALREIVARTGREIRIGERTERSTWEQWDQRKLGNARAPKEAKAFRLILRDTSYGRGHRSTGWVSLSDDSPEGVFGDLELDYSQLAAVVYER